MSSGLDWSQLSPVAEYPGEAPDVLPTADIVDGMRRFWEACVDARGEPTALLTGTLRARRTWRGKKFCYRATLVQYLKAS